MKTRGLRMNDGGWQARNVLECGSPLPLSAGGTRPVAAHSARGLAPSKTWRNFVAALAFLAMAMAAHSQSYSIDWFTIDGGGGTSRAAFIPSAAIGQC